MHQVASIGQNDRRILQTLTLALPDQPVLVAYIDWALRRSRGTLLVASKMGEFLARQVSACVAQTHVVNLVDVARLGVYEDEEAMGRLTPNLLRLCPDALMCATLLHMDVALKASPHDRIAPDSQAADDFTTFQRIFYCALAMLVDVKEDPRRSTAAA